MKSSFLEFLISLRNASNYYKSLISKCELNSLRKKIANQCELEIINLSSKLSLKIIRI